MDSEAFCWRRVCTRHYPWALLQVILNRLNNMETAVFSRTDKCSCSSFLRPWSPPAWAKRCSLKAAAEWKQIPSQWSLFSIHTLTLSARRTTKLRISGVNWPSIWFPFLNYSRVLSFTMHFIPRLMTSFCKGKATQRSIQNEQVHRPLYCTSSVLYPDYLATGRHLLLQLPEVFIRLMKI